MMITVESDLLNTKLCGQIFKL